MNYNEMSIEELHSLLVSEKIKPLDLVNYVFDEIEKNKDLNCFITLNKEEAIKTAKELEGKVEKDNLLWGLPIAVKDNIVTKDLRTTCASRMLDNFIPIYNSTVVEKLKDKKIEQGVFDRNGYLYHGVIAAFADALRENGIKL